MSNPPMVMARGITAIFIKLDYRPAPVILRALETSPDAELPEVRRFITQLRPIVKMGPEPQLRPPRE